MADPGFFRGGVLRVLCTGVLVGGCGPRSPAPTVGNAAVASASDTVKLVWVVGRPTIPHPTYEGVMLQPLTLEIATGAGAREVKLEPQMGSLFPFNQSACRSTAYPLAAGELAKITFYEGGAGGYVVRRGDGTKLELVAWSQPDGACADETTGDPVACPPMYERVGTIDAPVNARVEETILEVDAAGARTPMSCEEAAR